MEFSIESISPAMASDYLKTSLGNRPISKTAVRSYSDTMKSGKWMLNGVPIIFDEEGHLIDGHHRLEAILQSGTPVTMSVCRGVPSGAFTTYDCGLHRKLGQLLAMQGVANYTTVSSIVSTDTSLVRSDRIFANNGTRHGRMTNRDFYEIYSRDPEGYQEAALLAKKLYSVARILNCSWIGGLYYYLSHTGGYEKEFVKKWLYAVCNLETSELNAANKLREYILKYDRTNDKLRMRADALFAIVVKSWNAYVTQKNVQRFSFNSETEEYPRLRLNT